MLFYWYDPQYLNAQYDLVQVQLPKRFASCQDDEKKGGDPKKYACAYPSYRLDKLVSDEFAKSGSPALKVIRKFKWSAKDQNFVANLISGKKLSKGKAAEKWVKANARTVNAWLEVDDRTAGARRRPRPCRPEMATPTLHINQPRRRRAVAL